MDKRINKAGFETSINTVELADGRMWRRHIGHLRRAEERVTKSGGSESEIDDEQMTQSAKKEEKRTALEETTGVQIEQDMTEGEGETETNERMEITRKPEVAVARHWYQLRQNRRPPDRYKGERSVVHGTIMYAAHA